MPEPCIHFSWTVATPPPATVDETICFRDSAHPNETRAQFIQRCKDEFNAQIDAHPPV